MQVQLMGAAALVVSTASFLLSWKNSSEKMQNAKKNLNFSALECQPARSEVKRGRRFFPEASYRSGFAKRITILLIYVLRHQLICSGSLGEVWENARTYRASGLATCVVGL